MIVQQTLTQLRNLSLDGMAHAFEEQITLPSSNTLPFEDRFAMLVDREAAHRNDRRLTRLLAKARLKYGQACLENLDTRTSRGLDSRLITSLGHGEWIERGQPLLISGPAGVGKTWLACALAQKACRLGKSALLLTLAAACSRSCVSPAVRASTNAGSWRSPRSRSWCSTTGRCNRWNLTAGKISWKSWTIAPNGTPLSSPRSYPSNTGMVGSATPRSPMPSSTGSCITLIA